MDNTEIDPNNSEWELNELEQANLDGQPDELDPNSPEVLAARRAVGDPTVSTEAAS